MIKEPIMTLIFKPQLIEHLSEIKAMPGGILQNSGQNAPFLS